MLQLFVLAVLCLASTSAIGQSQSPCPAGVASDKLICAIPQAYGPNGLVLQNLNAQALGIQNQFQNGLPQALRPLNTSIARQTALIALASPSSGITFSWDAAAKIFVTSTGSFGPILGERADTIGKYRLSIGFAYEYFDF